MGSHAGECLDGHYDYFFTSGNLLRNFILPMIILLAIPIAAAGGIGGLAY